MGEKWPLKKLIATSIQAPSRRYILLVDSISVLV